MNAPPLRIVLLLKTTRGGLWTVPQAEALIKRGHRVTAILPAGPGPLPAALAAVGVCVLTSAFDFRLRPTAGTVRGLWRLRRQIRALRPDVLHYHLYTSALAARLSTIGLPLSRVHMVAGPLHLESTPIRWCERLLARLDHVTVGGSAHTARIYRDLGLADARTPVVPYGVDTAAFTPPSATGRARARADLGLTDDHFLVIMVAYVYGPKQIVHRGFGVKGHDVLLEAWDRFAANRPQARLLLVGGGFDERGERHRRDLIRRFRVGSPGPAAAARRGAPPEPTTYPSDPADPASSCLASSCLAGPRAAAGGPAEALAWPAGSRVWWMSTVDDVRRYYAAADLSVCPSRSENHGAALEAGAMGVPCLVSDAGGLPEAVGGGGGWVVGRGDVAALVAGLDRAYRQWQRGGLTGQGALARRWVTDHFDQRSAADRLAGVIEGAQRHRRAGSGRPGPKGPAVVGS